MLNYILFVTILLLCLFSAGYLLKRKHYKEVDRLEEWKLNIMERPVLDELSKVKQLNMTGQTEQLFEKWRDEWDEIVTVHLPDVEDFFMDAEDYIEKYRFKKAKQAQENITGHLNKIEQLIQHILLEVNDLVGSEEKNRSDIEELKQLYRKMRKALLARRHSFGVATNHLEQQLDNVIDLFYTFEEKTTNGDYLEAREHVFQIKKILEELNAKMDSIPRLLIECQTTIPALLKQLSNGYQEMLADGYVLTHIQLEKELDRLQKALSVYISFIENTEVDEVEKGLEDMKESMEDLFDLLEKEVHAKHYLLKNHQETDNQIKKALEQNDTLKNETETVQKSYQLGDVDAEACQRMEKELSHLLRRFELLVIKIKNQETAQTELSQELKEIEQQLTEVFQEQEQFSEKLKTLRRDEVIAKEKVIEMRKKVKDITRLLSRSNLPGLPQTYEYTLQDAKSSIRNVKESLDEKPLHMDVVQKHLEVALLTVENLENATNEMLEDVTSAESVIQYGNRYRSRYPLLSERLDEAEIAFRNFQYKEALEQAATAIEEVEPGALKRVEKLLQEQLSNDA